MSDIYFSNLELVKDTDYFLYIGELKNYGLNLFLSETLSRIHQRKFDFISIVPDVFEQYNYNNIIVINPRAKSYRCKYGREVSCRISGTEFAACASANEHVLNLVQGLLRRQDHVYIYMYESMPEMALDAIDGVFVLGPDSQTARRLNSKIYQYKHLKETIPVVDFRVCSGLQELIETAENLQTKWREGIFVSQEYSAAGVNSIVAYSTDDIRRRFCAQDDVYLISRYVPHNYDPTVLAVVAGENDIYIAGVADQRIEDGTRFTGSTFPSTLDSETVATLGNYTRLAGNWMAREGYRGIYGCDYLVDKRGDVRFLEINARKQGTTMEFCCTLEQSLPDGAPILPELEYWAVTTGKFPENTAELSTNPRNIHWGTYNYKMGKRVRTSKHIPRKLKEREAFQKVADGSLSSDHIVLEHTGNDFVVAEGAFIGRVVAIGHDHGAVEEGLARGREKLESSFYDMQNSENENE